MKLKQLGPYRIVKQIGKGGMGAVYEAVASDTTSNASKRVAIKALSPQLAMADGFRERFEAEIESLKKLKHPGIVRLYGYGEQDSVLFYSMELVDGPSLEEEIINGRRFDWRETLQFGIQICRALKHAHDHGVVHRDIKPANLMLTSDERVKIADFGIARLFGGTQLTTAGGVLGTADYMSPEQADGRAVTDACDQYSLGGVMYALLAGRPPFKAKTMPEMLQLQRFAEPEPVRRYAADTPEQLERLISQLLAKDPNERFPNVLVLSRHMEAMEKALSRPVKPENSDDLMPTNFAATSSQVTASIEEQATRALDGPVMVPGETDVGTHEPNIYDAPTLDQASESQAPSLALTPALVRATAQTNSAEIAKTSHFTTVDEDARRQQELRQGSRVGALAQLGLLAATLGALIWGGWQLMKPPTANELFERINSSSENGVEGLPRELANDLANDVDAFLSRFPQDSRAEEMKPVRDQLEFLTQERSARARSKYTQTAGQPPLEQIYFQAVAVSKTDPEQALTKLRALLALYDPSGDILDFDSAKVAIDAFKQVGDPRLLVVARQRIEGLAEAVQQIRSTHLPALQARIQDANRLSQTNPVQAKRIYQAIIELYGDRIWARGVVSQAKDAVLQP